MNSNPLRTFLIKFFLVVAALSFPLVQENVAHAQTKTTSTAKRPVPDRVQRFCRDAVNFPATGDDHQIKAKQFATKLCDSITANKRVSRITPTVLSVEAAKKLADYFHEDIVAALAYKEVVGYAAVLKTFMQSVRGEQAWRRIPLVEKHELIPKPLTDVPEVIVTVGDRDRLTSTLTASATKAKKLAELRQAYKTAYRDHHGWFKAIASYFEEAEDDDGDE